MPAPLIAIFCSSFPPEGEGASMRMYNMARLLAGAGYRVQVVCAMPNYPTGKIFPAYRGRQLVDEEVDGIAVRRVGLIPSNAASPWKRALSAATFVASLRLRAYRHVLRMNPALIFVSSPPLPMAADVVRYYSKREVRILLNVSDIWPLSAAALGAVSKGPLYKGLVRLEARMYARAQAFAAQSGETLRHIFRLVPSSKPSMLYRNLPAGNYGDEGRILPSATPVRIVYAGMLGYAQGLLALCKAIHFRALSAELHIYGEGPEDSALRSWIAAHPDRSVYFHEPVSSNALFEVLQQSRAMLVPLVTAIEGAVPSKLFTAFQAGVPVIYSGGGEGAKIVSELGLGWVVTPSDYEAIATSIKAVAAQPVTEQLALRRHILEMSKTVFDKSRQDEDFLRLIQSLITA